MGIIIILDAYVHLYRLANGISAATMTYSTTQTSQITTEPDKRDKNKSKNKKAAKHSAELTKLFESHLQVLYFWPKGQLRSWLLHFYRLRGDVIGIKSTVCNTSNDDCQVSASCAQLFCGHAEFTLIQVNRQLALFDLLTWTVARCELHFIVDQTIHYYRNELP